MYNMGGDYSEYAMYIYVSNHDVKDGSPAWNEFQHMWNILGYDYFDKTSVQATTKALLFEVKQYRKVNVSEPYISIMTYIQSLEADLDQWRMFENKYHVSEEPEGGNG